MNELNRAFVPRGMQLKERIKTYHPLQIVLIPPNKPLFKLLSAIVPYPAPVVTHINSKWQVLVTNWAPFTSTPSSPSPFTPHYPPLIRPQASFLRHGNFLCTSICSVSKQLIQLPCGYLIWRNVEPPHEIPPYHPPRIILATVSTITC